MPKAESRRLPGPLPRMYLGTGLILRGLRGFRGFIQESEVPIRSTIAWLNNI
jgi:hypothetical protein